MKDESPLLVIPDTIVGIKEEILKQVQDDRKRTPVTWVKLEILKLVVKERTLKGCDYRALACVITRRALKGRGYRVCVLKQEIRMTKGVGRRRKRMRRGEDKGI